MGWIADAVQRASRDGASSDPRPLTSSAPALVPHLVERMAERVAESIAGVERSQKTATAVVCRRVSRAARGHRRLYGVGLCQQCRRRGGLKSELLPFGVGIHSGRLLAAPTFAGLAVNMTIALTGSALQTARRPGRSAV